MGFGVFFVPLVGGYLFLKYCHYTRFSIRRASGHKLVLESAVMGLVLVALARIGISAVGMLTVSLDWVGETWARLAPFTHADTVTLAFVLGPLLARLVNIFYSESRGLTRTIDDAGNTMELLFVESMASDSTVELTMLNGKVYVGWILNANVAEPERKFVDLLPLASGYRAAETHEVTFTTNYAAVWGELSKNQTGSDQESYRVVVPVSEIRSARPFDFEVFFLFQETSEDL